MSRTKGHSLNPRKHRRVSTILVYGFLEFSKGRIKRGSSPVPFITHKNDLRVYAEAYADRIEGNRQAYAGIRRKRRDDVGDPDLVMTGCAFPDLVK